MYASALEIDTVNGTVGGEGASLEVEPVDLGEGGVAEERGLSGEVFIDSEGAIMEPAVVVDLALAEDAVVGVGGGLDGEGVVDEVRVVGVDDAAGGAADERVAQPQGADGVLDGGPVLQLHISLQIASVDLLLVRVAVPPDLNAGPDSAGAGVGNRASVKDQTASGFDDDLGISRKPQL